MGTKHSTKHFAKHISFTAPKRFAPLARCITIVVIVLSTLLVAFNVFASSFFDPRAIVDRELSSLAKEYYEDYLYKNLVGTRTGDAIGEELKRYKDAGVSNTYLRQLLLYDSGRRQDAASHFNHKGYTCDRNQTYVKYYPEPPYGKKDYHFVVNLVCE